MAFFLLAGTSDQAEHCQMLMMENFGQASEGNIFGAKPAWPLVTQSEIETHSHPEVTQTRIKKK